MFLGVILSEFLWRLWAIFGNFYECFFLTIFVGVRAIFGVCLWYIWWCFLMIFGGVFGRVLVTFKGDFRWHVVTIFVAFLRDFWLCFG